MKTVEEILAIAHFKVSVDFDNGKRVGIADTLKYSISERDQEWQDKIEKKIRPLSKKDEEENYIQPLIAFDIGYNRALKELLEEK